MDKQRHKPIGEITGRRFQLARNLKRHSIQELADYFHLEVSTIKKWQQRGIPKNAIAAVAHLFNVEEWLFTDEKLSDEDFKKIILDTALLEKYKPSSQLRASALSLVKSFKKYKKSKTNEGRIFRSDPFYISSNSVLIVTTVWGMEGITNTQVLFEKKDLEPTEMIGNRRLYPTPTFYIVTSENTLVSDKFVQQDILNKLKKGRYYLIVFSEYFFEVNIYEIKS